MSRRIAGIAAAALLLVLGAWYVGFWSPHTGELARTNAATSQARDHYQALAGQYAGLRAQTKTVPAREAALLTAEAGVPTSPELDRAIDQVAAAASAAGVMWENESQSAPSAPAPAKGSAAAGSTTSVQMTLTVGGPYQRTLAFLDALTKMPRLFVVDTVTFGGAASSTLQITGRIFYDTTPLPKLPPVAAASTHR